MEPSELLPMSEEEVESLLDDFYSTPSEEQANSRVEQSPPTQSAEETQEFPSTMINSPGFPVQHTFEPSQNVQATNSAPSSSDLVSEMDLPHFSPMSEEEVDELLREVDEFLREFGSTQSEGQANSRVEQFFSTQSAEETQGFPSTMINSPGFPEQQIFEPSYHVWLSKYAPEAKDHLEVGADVMRVFDKKFFNWVDNLPPRKTRYVRLSKTLTMKMGPSSEVTEAEARNMEEALGWEYQPVRLPKIYGSFRNRKVISENTLPVEYVHIVMERIEGTRLQELWGSLSPDDRINICDKIVGMMINLRSHRKQHRQGEVGPVVGPVGGGLSRGLVFPKCGAGPFDNVMSLQNWLNTRLPGSMDHFDFSKRRSEFIHGDIHPRNFIMDGQDQLWLLNWQNAGYYPVEFEIMALRSQRRNPDDKGPWNARLAVEKRRALFNGDDFADTVLRQLPFTSSFANKLWKVVLANKESEDEQEQGTNPTASSPHQSS